MTFRATAIGLALAIAINIWITYSEFAVRSSLMTIAHIPVIVLCPLFLLTAVVNPILICLRASWRLTTEELFGVFAMGLIASTIPGFGFANYFFRVIIPVQYFASPENQWATLLFPHLPDWLVVSNDHQALTWFFEGLPEGRSIPWFEWVIPFGWWLPFIAALFLAGASVIVMLRKQWVEHEKLPFPLIHIPLAMMRQEEGHAIPPYVRNRLFWIGFSIPVFIIGWNCIDYFIPIGVIPIGTSYQTMLSLGQDFPATPVKINFMVLAFAFFTNVEVLFSIWFFQGIATLMVGLLNRFGASGSAGTLGLNSVMLSHYFGGFVVLVLWTLWTARRHLAGVVRLAISPRGDGFGDDEIVSYRSAVLSLVFSGLFIAFWLTASGMDTGVMVVFLITLFVLYLGIARIVAETGLAYLDMPVNANEFTVGLMGSGNLSPGSLVSLGLANVYARNWRLFSMTALSHLLYGERTVKRSKSSNLFGVLCLSGIISMATVILWTLYMGYNPDRLTSFGGAGDGAGAAGVGYIQIMVTWMQNKTTISSMEQLFFGLGLVISSGLIGLRYYFPGWPIHPIGFAIAGSNVVRVVTFAIFLAWLIKVILLRVGGVSLYKRTQPIFIGLLAGYTLAVVAASVIDAIWFPGQGHPIHTW